MRCTLPVHHTYTEHHRVAVVALHNAAFTYPIDSCML